MLPLERRSAASLASIFALRMLGLFLILPVFAVYARNLPGGQNHFMVGLTLGIYGLTQGLLQVPFGVASDRLGRKPVIVFGLVIFALGSALAAVADSIFWVMIGRAIQGAGAISAAVTAMLADSVRDRVITRAMAMVGSSIGLTFAFSLIASPLLSELIGVSGLFWLTAILSAVAVPVMLWIVPPAAQAKASDPVSHQPWQTVVFDGQLLRLNAGIFILHLVLMALFVVIPTRLVALDLPLRSHWHIYLPAVLLSFAFMMPLIVRAERSGRTKLLFLVSIGLLALVFAGFACFGGSIPGISVLLLVFFVGFNILEASLPSLVTKTAPPADKGLALGVYNTTQSIGLFAGGAIGGWLSNRFGSNGVYACCAALMLVWLALVVGMRSPKKRQSGEEIDLAN